MDIFNYTFFQNALWALLLISIISAIIGTYIVARRMLFITGGITHASFGGLGIGYFLGISPTLSALFFAILSALGVEWMSRGKPCEKTRPSPSSGHWAWPSASSSSS